MVMGLGGGVALHGDIQQYLKTIFFLYCQNNQKGGEGSILASSRYGVRLNLQRTA